ncbi:hypothetical protein M3J09_000608 [Ascochyta lentis]
MKDSWEAEELPKGISEPHGYGHLGLLVKEMSEQASLTRNADDHPRSAGGLVDGGFTDCDPYSQAMPPHSSSGGHAPDVSSATTECTHVSGRGFGR